MLIDEYQDVNGLQVDLARSLGAHGPAITAVGDDFQAIYGFRSASAAHILDFPEHFPGTRVVTLERNYRSTQPRAGRRERARGAGRRAPSRNVCVRTGRAACARAWCGCATRPRRPRRSATASSRRASRAWSCARRRCSRARRTTPTCSSSSSPAGAIPFHKYGGLRYLEAAHVKDFVAALRLVDNGADDVAWFRVLQLVEGVGPVSARKAIGVMAGGESPLGGAAGADGADGADAEARWRAGGEARRRAARARRRATRSARGGWRRCRTGWRRGRRRAS